MQNVWYILIHVSLGMIGWKIFVWSNLGVLAAIAACGAVQIWPMYELHRITWPRFDAMRRSLGDARQRRRETRDYWIRMGRLYAFRSCAYAVITLFVAWLMRTAGI